MKTQLIVNWDKLEEVKELQEFFEEDEQGFKELIETQVKELSKFSDGALDKFAKLRVLEVTNGCLQWAFRRDDKECLSVEQTRECMNLVMGFMKRTEMYFPSEGLIEFDDKQKAFVSGVRSLYKSAFKDNIRKSECQFYAISTAQFLVFGRERLQRAMTLVKQDYEATFSPYYIEKGQKYITRYLEALN